jgi:hypothetical protein
VAGGTTPNASVSGGVTSLAGPSTTSATGSPWAALVRAASGDVLFNDAANTSTSAASSASSRSAALPVLPASASSSTLRQPLLRLGGDYQAESRGGGEESSDSDGPRQKQPSAGGAPSSSSPVPVGSVDGGPSAVSMWKAAVHVLLRAGVSLSSPAYATVDPSAPAAGTTAGHGDLQRLKSKRYGNVTPGPASVSKNSSYGSSFSGGGASSSGGKRSRKNRVGLVGGGSLPAGETDENRFEIASFADDVFAQLRAAAALGVQQVRLMKSVGAPWVGGAPCWLLWV